MDQGPDAETLTFDPRGPRRHRVVLPTSAEVLSALRRHPSRTVSALMVVLVVLVVLGVRAHERWTHPTLLGGMYGGGVSTSFRAGPGEGWTFPLSLPRKGHSDVLTFRGIPKDSWKVNTAAATLTVEVCRIDAPTIGLPGPGFATTVSTSGCLSVSPVQDGTTFRYPSPREYLLAVVRVAKPGRAALATISYDYQAGAHFWSPRGVDTQEFRLTFKASRPRLTSWNGPSQPGTGIRLSRVSKAHASPESDTSRLVVGSLE